MTKQLGLRMLVGLGVLVAVIFLVRGVGQHFHVAALPVLVWLSALAVFSLGLARQAAILTVAAGLVLLATGATILPGTPPSLAAVPPAPSRSVAAACHFQLGFARLAGTRPEQIGGCVDDEVHDPQTGDGQQHTTGGLLVWRKVDNIAAFTDGYWTWVAGPTGVVKRRNSERFSWESNPAHLALAAPP